MWTFCRAVVSLILIVIAVPTAAHAGAGELLWQDQLHEAGQFMRAHTVVVHRGRVLVGGVTGPDTFSGPAQALLRAYDAGSGALEWEARAEGVGGLGVLGLVADDDYVITVGFLPDLPRTPTRQFVRSYKLGTGQLLWQVEVETPSPDLLFAAAVTVRRGRVFVGGTTAPLTAFDAETGALIWRDASPTSVGDQIRSVAAKHHHVFAAGRVVRSSLGFADLFVRAYDARTGQIVWEDRVDGGFEDSAVTVLAHEGRVFVGGAISAGTDISHFQTDFAVRAYDHESGALLWQDLFDQAGQGDAAASIVAAGTTVFAAGVVVNDALTGTDLFLRAYETATGEVLWQDRFDSGLGDEARVAAEKNGRVYVGGYVNNEFDITAPHSEGVIRAYNARTGGLEWEGRETRLPWVTTLGVAVGGGRVFTVGGAHAAPSSDFLVTGWDAR